MNIDNDSVLPVCAVRYALGRQTYIPRMMVEEIEQMLPELSDRNLSVMAEDLNEYIKERESNGDFNKWRWEFLYDKIIQEQARRAGKNEF